VNVIYIHNGMMPSWRGKWPTPQMSIDGAGPDSEPTTRDARASRHGHRDRSWLPFLVAGRSCLPLFHTQEHKNGLLDHQDRWANKMERMQYKMEWMRNHMERRGSASVRPQAVTVRSTNTAWKPCGRLEEEQTEFRDFLDRLRHAKDKEESTSSWPSIAPVRRRPRMASRKPELSSLNLKAKASGVVPPRT